MFDKLTWRVKKGLISQKTVLFQFDEIIAPLAERRCFEVTLSFIHSVLPSSEKQGQVAKLPVLAMDGSIKSYPANAISSKQKPTETPSS